MYRLLFYNCSSNPRQSPIDIQTNNLVVDRKKCQPDSLRILTTGESPCYLRIHENGFNVTADDYSEIFLEASHLPGRYRFAQFHAHWSSSSECGSEHTVDGLPYAGEVHFVFWNTAYISIDRAVNQPNGLAVVAVFFEEGDFNSHLAPITSLITEARHTRSILKLSKNIELEKLIPIGSDYYTYDGSLTTPLYNECVVWTVMRETIQISANQFFHLRQICTENWRITQDLCDRTVYSSSSPDNQMKKLKVNFANGK